MREITIAGKVEAGAIENIIYGHRELPPLATELMGEYVVEATSSRVPGTLAHRDELWNQCYEDLMDQVRTRLEQEILRLGGNYAHVLGESVDSKHDAVSGEAWLHGRLTYTLYRRSASH
jgi:hypothetical protein